MAKLKVLVTGCTGQQGGSVARRLLERGHQVRGFTRNPDSASARDLARRGAELVQGDLEDQASIERALRGADAMFGVATPYESGTEDEERHARAIVEAARNVGVAHLVYSSVSDADRDTGIPHFDNKARVEDHLRSLDLPHTIVAPVFFFENFLSPWFLPGLKDGTLAVAMPPERELQMIALENVGEFTVLTMEHREQFLGRRINIASDELPIRSAAATIGRASGKPIEYRQLPIEQVRGFSEDSARMYEWFVREGYSVDIPKLRREYPQVNWLSFEDWARRQDWSVLEK